MRPLLPPLVLVLAAALTAAAALAAPPAQAPVTVEAAIDADEVTVGDRITLTLVVRHAAGIRMEPPLAEPLLGDLEVLAMQPPKATANPDGSGELHLTYVVAAFRSGDLSLLPPPIAYTTAEGGRAEVAAPALPIRVESVLPPGQATPDIRDLKPQLEAPGAVVANTRPLLLGLAAAAAALLAGGLAWRLRGRLRPSPRPAPPPAAITPAEEAARAELDRLAARGLVAKGEYKALYSALAVCIRRYLTERYDFPAIALTAGELEAAMVGRGLDRWQARLARGLLAECDAVVYAQYVPAVARAEADLTMAYEVLALAPVPGQEALSPGSRPGESPAETGQALAEGVER